MRLQFIMHQRMQDARNAAMPLTITMTAAEYQAHLTSQQLNLRASWPDFTDDGNPQ
jgi:hypothetical protein